METHSTASINPTRVTSTELVKRPRDAMDAAMRESYVIIELHRRDRFALVDIEEFQRLLELDGKQLTAKESV